MEKRLRPTRAHHNAEVPGRGLLEPIDVERIVRRQREQLEFPLIFEEQRPLLALKEEPENEDRLRKMMRLEGL